MVALAAIQAKILDRAVGLLNPGGALVYCVCSLEPEEGEAQIAALLRRNPDMVREALDPRLLEVLVCPVTRGKLTYDRNANELISAGAKLAYPIREGVPIMLAEEARQLD